MYIYNDHSNCSVKASYVGAKDTMMSQRVFLAFIELYSTYISNITLALCIGLNRSISSRGRKETFKALCELAS